MKKRIIPIIILLAFLGGYGAVSSFFTAEDNGPVYQEITVADSVFENKFYFGQLTEEEQLIYKELYQGVMPTQRISPCIAWMASRQG